MPEEKKEKKQKIAPKSVKKPRKNVKKMASRKISKRIINDDKSTKSIRKARYAKSEDKLHSTKHHSPSPSIMKKYQSAYDKALKKAVDIKSRASKKRTTPDKKSRRVVKIVEETRPKSRTVPKSSYQKFVQEKMKLPEMQEKSGPDRMRLIASMWKKNNDKKLK